MAKLRAPLPAFARRPADYSVSSTDRTDDVPAPLALLRRFDTCLASCLTSSLSTQSGKLDGKEAFGRHELVVFKMQSLPSGFQSGNSSDHSRVLSVTVSCRLFIGVLASGKHSCKVRRDSNFSHRTIPRRVCRTESVLLCE